MIDIAFLGTGAMMPTADRWLSSALIRIERRLILLDCGEGVQIPWRATGWGFKRLELICLSHWHADHIAGLPGVLHALALAGRVEPVTIIGPIGTRDRVAELRGLAPVLPFDVITADLADGQRWQTGPVTIDVRRGDHPVPVLVYRFSVPRKPAFLAEMAEIRGVPRAHWSKLADGFDVAQWRAADFTGPPRRGLAVGFMTDTRPTDSTQALLEGVDLLIAEGTYGADEDLSKAIQNKHMTFREAATVARAAHVGRLLLTHFSPKIDDPSLWLETAQAIFPATAIADTRSIVSLNYGDNCG